MRAWRNGRRARLRGVFVTECGFKSHRSHQNRATCFFVFGGTLQNFVFPEFVGKPHSPSGGSKACGSSRSAVRFCSQSKRTTSPTARTKWKNCAFGLFLNKFKKRRIDACFFILRPDEIALRWRFVATFNKYIFALSRQTKMLKHFARLFILFKFYLRPDEIAFRWRFVATFNKFIFALSRQTKWITGFVMLSRRRDSSTAIWMTTATRRNIYLDSSTQPNGWRRTSVRITRQWVRLTS